MGVLYRRGGSGDALVQGSACPDFLTSDPLRGTVQDLNLNGWISQRPSLLILMAAEAVTLTGILAPADHAQCEVLLLNPSAFDITIPALTGSASTNQFATALTLAAGTAALLLYSPTLQKWVGVNTGGGGGGGGTPASPDTSVQFNNAGNFGGSENFRYSEVTGDAVVFLGDAGTGAEGVILSGANLSVSLFGTQDGTPDNLLGAVSVSNDVAMIGGTFPGLNGGGVTIAAGSGTDPQIPGSVLIAAGNGNATDGGSVAISSGTGDVGTVPGTVTINVGATPGLQVIDQSAFNAVVLAPGSDTVTPYILTSSHMVIGFSVNGLVAGTISGLDINGTAVQLAGGNGVGLGQPGGTLALSGGPGFGAGDVTISGGQTFDDSDGGDVVISAGLSAGAGGPGSLALNNLTDTGASTPAFAATNKPGGTGGAGPDRWIRIKDGATVLWVPAWLN